MDTLEPNMYVRTKDGDIGKIGVIIDGLVFINTNQYYSTVSKASNNIIDLIKVGDYVNGYKVTSIQEVEEPYYPKRLLFVEEPPDYVLQCFNNEDIKSIVTKEQFESMSYEVGKC